MSIHGKRIMPNALPADMRFAPAPMPMAISAMHQNVNRSKDAARPLIQAAASAGTNHAAFTMTGFWRSNSSAGLNSMTTIANPVFSRLGRVP